jgi:tetratricopeptide (TPR) repeat protein
MAKLAQLPADDRALLAHRGRERHVPRLRTRFYAFLSYSHKDKELADWLHRELERFRVPHSLAGRLTVNGVVPRRLTPIFRDQQDLSAGADLAEEIKAALAASQFLVVLCSPTAATSRWTNAEIESFKRTRPEGCVLAAIGAGEPFASDIPGRESEECFPPALRYKYDRRGHQTTKKAEPLAADFREGAEGRRLAFLKLVAGMLGVGLDELVQRETTSRHRRMAWLAAASLGGMAVTSTLAITAIQARDAARDQRREAEGLVSFMVGDLKDKLEPIGRLDALDGVGARVLAYYRKQDTSELSDAALLQRSRALNLMASVAFQRGKMEQAEGLYLQAADGTAEAVRRSPNDTKLLFDHAQNVFWVGEVARFSGRPDRSEAAYRRYKQLADRLGAAEPDNLRYRMEVLYADEDIGISLYDQRRFAEARSQFEGALPPMEKLASLYPDNVNYQREVANALAWIADAQRSQGELKAATATRERQLSILMRLAGGVADTNIRRQLVLAHQPLGLLFVEQGQLDRAIEEFRAAVEEADGLMMIEPRNADWKRRAAIARVELARALFLSGRRDEAVQVTTAACNLAAALPAADTSPEKRSLRTNCFTMRARNGLAAGDMRRSIDLAAQALASARSELDEDPLRPRYRVASIYRLLGDVRQRSGDRQGANAAWSAGLAQLPARATERPWEMNERAELLKRVGRSAEARPLAYRLAQIGYHGLLL